MSTGRQTFWLALIIGNSRWHWGAFADDADSQGEGQRQSLGDRWLRSWHTVHLSKSQVKKLYRGHFALSAWQQVGVETALPSNTDNESRLPGEHPEIWLASVVDAPLTWLEDYPNVHLIKTEQVPLQNTYATLGVDRALALVGAGNIWGWPVLVIDCGTALTFTAGVDQRLLGGAILPGLRSQFRALHTHTDRLPALDLTSGSWPQRWAADTAEAMASGVLHTQLAGIRDFIAAWEADWPSGAVVLTGGDSLAIHHYIAKQTPSLAQRINHDPDLGFWGLRVCRQQQLKNLTL
ncbi:MULTISPECIES: pantothenate kinase [Cyanophyceae]|uniref:pantothenate kinase n=1 Tax=Cyanophyceae TaxID=3028117 RepID=UPI0016892E02|nr:MULTISPECIES: pantothenate kinase [Cyanophyceae]MBD1916817.1 pantothenate kinase [Phormidium sp. FACHB-77]MBD2029447.1 pantothenate kinase [Phormidium sp. FACHB-322]MBD2052023.1 pantothenate kinase [Leptolyngbya sp. FACHB-60]